MRLSKGLFLIFLLPLFLHAKPKKQKKMKFPFGTWMRSQEEDKDPNAGWLIYRPGSYPFPPARGRSGFMVRKDGKFALLGPSPSDRSDTAWGTWMQDKPGCLRISVSGTELKQLCWKSVEKGKLMVELK
jgi:hypothetical protein